MRPDSNKCNHDGNSLWDEIDSDDGYYNEYTPLHFSVMHDNIPITYEFIGNNDERSLLKFNICKKIAECTEKIRQEKKESIFYISHSNIKLWNDKITILDIANQFLDGKVNEKTFLEAETSSKYAGWEVEKEAKSLFEQVKKLKEVGSYKPNRNDPYAYLVSKYK